MDISNASDTTEHPHTARNVTIGLVAGMVLGSLLIATEAASGFATLLVSFF